MHSLASLLVWYGSGPLQQPRVRSKILGETCINHSLPSPIVPGHRDREDQPSNITDRTEVGERMEVGN